MNNITINVYASEVPRPVNKFYPYLIYLSKNNCKNTKKELEKIIKEMQSVHT